MTILWGLTGTSLAYGDNMGKHTKGLNVPSARQVRYGNTNLGDSVEHAEFKEINKKFGKTKWLCRKWVAQHVEFEFQLWRGDEKYPRTEKMTVYEAGKRNNAFAASFAEKLDKRETTRLWSWRMVDSKEYGMAIKERIRQFT